MVVLGLCEDTNAASNSVVVAQVTGDKTRETAVDCLPIPIGKEFEESSDVETEVEEPL